MRVGCYNGKQNADLKTAKYKLRLTAPIKVKLSLINLVTLININKIN